LEKFTANNLCLLINQIFALLTEQGAEVRSMRTKSNRLEELFVGLVQGDNA